MITSFHEERAIAQLSVYKTDKKKKRLNAVSLRKITDVALSSTPCAFVVSVGDNTYTLLARDCRDAEQWVTILNDIRQRVNNGQRNECNLS